MGNAETRIIKTFLSDRETEMVQETLDKAALQEKFTAKVTGIPHKFIALRAECTLASANISKSRGGDMGATQSLKENIKHLKFMNKKNGDYLEEKAITDNDSVLIIDLGYWYYKAPEKAASSGTTAKNTDVTGELLISTPLVHGAKCYKVEGKIVGTNIPIKFDPIVVAKGQIVNNFISGDLYLIRTCPMFSDGTSGEWSDYFEIRAR